MVSDRSRRGLLGAALACGVVAVAGAPRAAEATNGVFYFGKTNDAGTERTALTAAVGSNGTLLVQDTSAYGIGVKATSNGGYALWGEGSYAGVYGRGLAGVEGVSASADGVGVTGSVSGVPTLGQGMVGIAGNRAGLMMPNVGVLGYALGGSGVVAEGGGGTGLRAHWDTVAAGSPLNGVGVHATGFDVGVLAETSGGGTAVRATAAAGRALDATGNVRVDGEVNVSGTSRLRGRVVARCAGRTRVSRGAQQREVALPRGIALGARPAILLTPMSDPGAGRYHAERVSASRFRIVLSEVAAKEIQFAYAVLN